MRPFRHGEIVNALNTFEVLKEDVFRRGRTVSMTQGRAVTVEQSFQAFRQLVEAVDNTGLKIDQCVECRSYVLSPCELSNVLCPNCSDVSSLPGCDATETLLELTTEVGHGS